MTSNPSRRKARQVDQSDEEEDVNMKSDYDSDSEFHLYSDPDPPPSPKGFCSLPLEIRERILILACGLPRVHHRRDPGLSTQCTKTINRLSLVSRALYAQMMPILYENVRLTRPSDLRIFHTTIVARPALGQYVKRLHVGAVEPFSKDWWPIHGGEGKRKLRIALVDRPLDELNMPSWLCPTQAFELEEKPKTDLDKALRAAIDAASRDLDVGLLYYRPYSYLYDYAGNELGSDLWHIRIHEVQAAFELYLGELGRLEKARSETTANSSHDVLSGPQYPRLAIHSGSAVCEAESSGGDTFWLSPAQIMEHTTRRRARTDHFSHPLLLCRSGMPWNYPDANDDWHSGDAGLIGDEDVERIDGGSADWVDVGFKSRLRRAQLQVIDFIDAGVVMPRIDVTNPFDTGLPNTATVGGISALARSLLSFTPFVESLSFTGFLDRIVGGIRPPPCLSFLRSLNLRPPIEWWRNSLRLDHAALNAVERLRICGRELTHEELDFVAGKNRALSKLKSFQWSQLDGCEEYNMTLEGAITSLVSAGEAPTANVRDVANAGNKRQRKSSELDGNNEEESSILSPSSGSRCCPLYIEARLNSTDFKEVMDKIASSDEVRKAWRAGALLPNSRSGNRFKVVVGIEAAEKWSEAERRKIDWTIMEEGRDWWEADGTDS